MNQPKAKLVVAMVAALAAIGIAAPAFSQPSPVAGFQLAQTRMPEPEQDPDIEMRMPVPGGGGNLGVRGCWRNKQILYGKYRISFCLERGVDGAYRVEGGGLTCRGDIDWSRDGRRVEIRLNRGRCNRNTDWSRDRNSCRIEDGRTGGLASLSSSPLRHGCPLRAARAKPGEWTAFIDHRKDLTGRNGSPPGAPIDGPWPII